VEFYTKVLSLCEACTDLTDLEFIKVMSLFHDVMIDWYPISEISPLSVTISLICEKVYFANKDDDRAHCLVPHNFTYLLDKSLRKDGKKTDVKRVWGMKDALQLLDENNELMKQLLSSCAISPLYLSSEHGIKFITFLFNLTEEYCEFMHDSVTPQLAQCKESILEVYADIYFKAWKAAVGKVLLKMEYVCIQDLMYHTIHCRDPTLFKNLRVILDGFHNKKKITGVDEMLLRLYEPILFRALNVANSTVRKNASAILVDSFPLLNPDHNKEETTTNLEKQFALLNGMLMDDYPTIRCIAVEGICKVLCVYWEIVPPEQRFDWLKTLVNDMSQDSSSPSVRASVLGGLTYLLDNHMAQTILKDLLKALGWMIHDSSKMVRSAFLDLLIKIRNLRSIHFYDVVNVDDLLTHLACDPDDIGKKIADLLLSSFCPSDKPASEQMSRCLDFIKANSVAAKKFYSYVVTLESDVSVVKFIHVVNKYLRKVILEKPDPVSMESLIEIQYILFKGVLKHIKDKKLREKTIEEFDADYLSSLQEKFPSNNVSGYIWGIAKYLTDNQTFKLKSLSALEKMCEDGYIKPNYTSIIQCCLEWNYEKGVFDIIEKYLSKTYTSVSKKKRIETVFDPAKGSIALDFLDYMKRSTDSISDLLVGFQTTLLEYLDSGVVNTDMEEFLEKALYVHFKMILREDREFDVLGFVVDKLQPCLYTNILVVREEVEETSGKRSRDGKEVVKEPTDGLSFVKKIAKVVLAHLCDLVQMDKIVKDKRVVECISGFLQERFHDVLFELYPFLVKLSNQLMEQEMDGSQQTFMDILAYYQINKIPKNEPKNIITNVINSQSGLAKSLVDKCIEEVSELERIEEMTPFLEICDTYTSNTKFGKEFVKNLDETQDVLNAKKIVGVLKEKIQEHKSFIKSAELIACFE
jgi:predicted house-cleaning noncanonical NTP pyrophosphatase (MazG superfamily)